MRDQLADPTFTVEYQPQMLPPPRELLSPIELSVVHEESADRGPTLLQIFSARPPCYSLIPVRTAWAVNNGKEHRQFATRKEAVDYATENWGCK